MPEIEHPSRERLVACLVETLPDDERETLAGVQAGFLDSVSATREGGTQERTAPWTSAQPASIGRYKVQRLLGQGGFGIVYLAYDEPLDRSVAIKVPLRERIGHAGRAQGAAAVRRT